MPISTIVSNIGVLCLPFMGHMNGVFPLARAIAERGHKITVIGVPDQQEAATRNGFSFSTIGEREFPLGVIPEYVKESGSYSRLKFLRAALGSDYFPRLHLRLVPPVIKDNSISALLVDQVIYEGGTIAESCGIPFVTVATDIPQAREANIPPNMFGWKYSDTAIGRVRNCLGYTALNYLMRPTIKAIAEFRRDSKLAPLENFNDFFSKTAYVSQFVQQLDYPRKNPPTALKYFGPLHSNEARPKVEFPYDKLNGKPIVYCCFGSHLGNLSRIFLLIASACSELDVQLIISLGGVNSAEFASQIPDSFIVVPFAPQIEILKRAALMIGHAGPNGVLESLGCGVPMVLIPKANDGFGCAARVARSGAGVVVLEKDLSAAKLRTEIDRILRSPEFKAKAYWLKDCIQNSGGLSEAVDYALQGCNLLK